MIDVVGVGAAGLPPAGTPERSVIDSAEVILGGRRHLELLPPTHPARRLPWPSPLRPGLHELLSDLPDQRVVALASGDPMVSGIGSTLVDILGVQAVRIHPAVSSVALARARMGWSAESTSTVTVVGRGTNRLRRDLHPRAKLVVLLSGPQDVADIAGLATQCGYGPSQLTVFGDLGTAEESRRTETAQHWSEQPPTGLPALCLLTIEACKDLNVPVMSTAGGLPDQTFDNDGQLTKRHVRATALAHLAPTPGDLLWDLGAGAGSIGIEWARHHPRNQTVSVERHPERAARIVRNAHTCGVADRVTVVHRAVDDFLADQAADTPVTGRQVPPDAIFMGGGAREATVAAAYDLLTPGGRIVVHGVTAETETLCVQAYRRWGGEIARIAVETAEPIGAFLGWTPARTVVQWSAVKPDQEIS
ncbi:Precorrin-6Y C(5,15)-methyltransferase [decarboxylating] [Austwickia sp. TVS 96-490-7B]|uniref:precorrin-6y C5,15-methyltransferase (decarboxylating) subunit CbiE n=1 Tax=Austwickia sp. TVS 96-490-7B TaxID=2830843 RepID=UPI001C59A99C|nr:precorrin-6y C5,15-methyltransferase (decarboxylating) subunit CbiE [Austwickia sp. TVS 96-490-7B]MBW3085971.1 Precorrin-6Y C(5,15)-methyltransferase [decarboxylating] [Austwickia sp. TVS 96-490-7B]